ncbi:MAG TPA: hypothetical protein PKH09_15670, partial [Parvularculaceae bacterium]|nr:hypothetical protein [Parvularculaceae bacterium]
RRNRRAAGALSAITAAVLGVIANLAFWFAAYALFSRTVEVRLSTVFIAAPDISTFDFGAATIGIVAAVALMRFHANAIVVIGASLLAGILLRSLA